MNNLALFYPLDCLYWCM